MGSDIFYWIALTMFQTGLPFFVTSLLKLPETMTTLYFVGMTALSLVFYIPVNKLTPKLGKKKMILFAFAVFSLAYFYTGNRTGIDPDGGGSAADGDFRNFAPGGCGRYRPE